MFDTTLEGLNGRKDRKRRLSTPILVGAGLHAAAVLCLLGAGLWTVDDSIEAPDVIVFPVTVHLEQDGDGGRGHTAAHATERKEPVVRRQDSISSVRSFDPTPDTTPQNDVAIDTNTKSTGDTRIGAGDGPGSGSGKEGSGPGDGPVVDGPGVEPIHVGGKVLAPVLLLREEPSYPETARRIGAVGTVVLEAVISASGEVENVRVLKSAHPLLDAAAVHAVGAWRYRPATLGGRAVRVYLTVTVNFALR